MKRITLSLICVLTFCSIGLIPSFAVADAGRSDSRQLSLT